MVGQRLELHEILAATRPIRVAWLLPPDPTDETLLRVIQWSTEQFGLWQSAMWPVQANGRLDRVGEYLLRLYDPDFVYGAGANADIEQIATLLNPFETFSDDIVEIRDDPAINDVIDVARLERAEPDHSAVVRRLFAGDRLRHLWAASQVGVLGTASAEALEASGTPVETLDCNLDQAGQVAVVASEAFESPLEAHAIAPRLLQGKHLGMLSRVSDNWYQTPAAIVVGDTSNDLCLYWTLRALRSGVYWVPRSAVGHWPQVTQLVQSLIRYRIPQSHQSTTLISLSVDMVDLQVVADQLTTQPVDQQHPAPAASGIGDIRRVLPGTMVVFLAHAQRRQSLLFLDRVSGAELPTASKGRIAYDEPGHLHLINEVTVTRHLVPPRAVYNDRLIPRPLTGVRASRLGWSFRPVRAWTFPYDTWESAQAGYRLRLDPDVEECLLAIPKELAPRLSAAGQYISGAARLFDGPLEAAAFLTAPPIARLMDGYKHSRQIQANAQVPGVVYHERRYFDFDQAQTLMDLPEGPARATQIEELVDKSVLRRGFALRCPECSWMDFYRVGTFGETFECRRCTHPTQWQLAHMKETKSPTLLYALDEIVFQMVANDGLAVLRALLWLADGSASFMVAPGVDTTWEVNDIREFDGVLLIDGRVVLLEVKNTDQISNRQMGHYRAMANRIRADEVCFATTKQWAPGTLVRIDEVRASLRPKHIGVRSQTLELALLN